MRSMVEKIAMEPGIASANTQQLRRKVDDYLNVNGLYTLTASAFSVEQVAGKSNVRALAVNYEVRKHWIANIDFLTSFNYSVELGKAGAS